jgi:hypothetical protein
VERDHAAQLFESLKDLPREEQGLAALAELYDDDSKLSNFGEPEALVLVATLHPTATSLVGDSTASCQGHLEAK